jgi:hypothetical protein
MKLRLLTVPAVAILIISSVYPAVAQEMPKGQLFAIHQDEVIPSKAEQYEAAAKKLASLLEQNNMSSMAYIATNTTDFHYNYIMPVENYAGIDKMHAAWGELETKLGEEGFKDLMTQFEDTYYSSKAFLVRMLPELSYKPDYGMDPSAEMNFLHWDFYHIYPGKEADAFAIANEWKALHEKHNIAEGYRIYLGDIGTDSPVLVVVQSAKSGAEYTAASEKNMDTFGEEGQELLKRTWALVRKFHQKEGMVRPDLSYQPTSVATTVN